MIWRSTNLTTLYFQCDVLLTGLWYMTGWDYRQLQSRIEKSQAPQPVPELPNWMARESIEEIKEAPSDGFPGKGMMRKANFYCILAKISQTSIFWSCWNRRQKHRVSSGALTWDPVLLGPPMSFFGLSLEICFLMSPCHCSVTCTL